MANEAGERGVEHRGVDPVSAEPVGVERIGVLGGTFDPFHFGHLAIALEVRYRLGLDRVLLVVANDPWQKSDDREITPAPIRLAMVEAAVEGLPGVEASAMEIARGGESYMADTLQTLRRDHEGAELFHVVGSDVAAGLDTWKRPDEVRDSATTVVVDRGGREDGRPPPGWDHLIVEVPALEISSSDLRNRFRSGQPVEALVPAPVIEIVRREGLYGARP
jgi:nicotinate-nucleotide adenylyltransferase